MVGGGLGSVQNCVGMLRDGARAGLNATQPRPKNRLGIMKPGRRL